MRNSRGRASQFGVSGLSRRIFDTPRGSQWRPKRDGADARQSALLYLPGYLNLSGTAFALCVRAQMVKRESSHVLVTNLTKTYPALQSVAASIKAEPAILDGEIVALDKDSTPHSEGLKRRILVTSRLFISLSI